MVITNSLDQEMVNPSKNIRSEGLKAHSKEKGIMHYDQYTCIRT